MSPATRSTVRQIAGVLAVILICLVFRRGFYVVERAALELRYFWWLFLIVAAGIWLLVAIGRQDR